MAGWDTAEGTSVSATDRLRAALPRRRRKHAARPAEVEQTPEDATGLREDHLRLVSDYIVDYPEDTNERRRCNRAFHPDEAPLEQAAG